MNDLNITALSGRLTRDPELRQTSSGTSVCQMGVAVNSSYKDTGGQWQERASFFDVVVWGGQGEACARHLAKGDRVTVGGRLDQRSWEAQDGTKRSKVEIVADRVIFGGQGGGQGQSSQPTASPSQDEFRDIDWTADDVPF